MIPFSKSPGAGSIAGKDTPQYYPCCEHCGHNPPMPYAHTVPCSQC